MATYATVDVAPAAPNSAIFFDPSANVPFERLCVAIPPEPTGGGASAEAVRVVVYAS